MRKPNWKTLSAGSIQRTVSVRAWTGVISLALSFLVLGCASDAGQDEDREAAGDVNRQGAASSSGDLNELSWMVGYWARIEGDSSFEEAWLPPRGGVMVGVHVDLSSSGRPFFEYLRVESRGDTLIYFASPRGEKTVPFVASEIAPGRAVFSNLSHDYPQHIGYTLVGTDSLKSEIWSSSDGDERRSSVTWGRSNL